MTDTLTREQRSQTMRSVKGTNTGPERRVRSVAHSLGYRFRLHCRDLPGKPDLVFPCHHKVIFVHGCFWHGHSCKRGARVPATNQEYWVQKIARNMARDTQVCALLSTLGWKSLVVWECETDDRESLGARLQAYLG